MANGFLEFDPNKEDLMSQEAYESDSQRMNGVSSGLARSEFHNKMFRQFSVMCAAFGEIVSKYGLEASDEDKVILAESLEKIMMGAANIKVSDTTKSLYGLTSTTNNVDIALQKQMKGGLLNAALTGFSKTSDTGDILSTDTLTKALNKLANNAGNVKAVLTGTYTGDGAGTVNSSRAINIGYTPKLVIIYPKELSAFSVFSIKIPYLSATFGVNSQNLVQKAKTETSYNYGIVESGFNVNRHDSGSTGYGTNESNVVYEYIAFDW